MILCQQSMKKISLFRYLPVLVCASALNAAPIIGNASFETPDLSSGQFEYAPVLGTPWVYANAGIGSNGPGGFFIPTTPDGDQAAFLQTNVGSISQSVSGFEVGVSYTLSFYLAKRTGGCNECGPTIGDLSISALVNGSEVFGAFNVGTLGSEFVAFTSDAFTATATTMDISFVGSGPGGDRTAFVDAVTLDVSAVPEPASIALGAIGLAGLAVARRFRK